MVKHKNSVFIDNRLAPESLAFRLGGAADAVTRVAKGQSLPDALTAVFSDVSADTAARGAIQDIAYHTLRHLGLVRFLTRKLTTRPPEPVMLQSLLHCALALLIPENNTLRYEPYTTVDQAVKAAAAIRILGKAKGLVNAVLRRFLREQPDLLKAAQQDLEASWNYPGWWIERARQAYPVHWKTVLSAGNGVPPLTLRVNVRKTTVTDYLELAEAAGIECMAIGPYAVKLIQPIPVNRIPGFMEGLVSVQDAAAQLAAPLLGLEDGMRVLDACAAPGGKACHMLEMADIDLLALDCDHRRLRMIHENLERLGLKADTKTGDASRSDWWDKRLFDCILADVPCTASGIIRRHPDIRWLRRQSDSHELSLVSAGILKNLWPMLKPGGKLLLATCSIWPEESERQAEAFASHFGALRLSAPGQLLPTANGMDDHDGLFYALFKKT